MTSLLFIEAHGVLVAGYASGLLCYAAAETGALLHSEWGAHTDSVTNLFCIEGEGLVFASAGLDGVLCLWSVKEGGGGFACSKRLA